MKIKWNDINKIISKKEPIEKIFGKYINRFILIFFLNLAFLFLFTYFFHLFLFIGGYLLYNIVVVSAIHWHESAVDLHVFPILIPPPPSLPIPSLWIFLVHQPWALVSWIQPGRVICFTLDSILVSMLFSKNIPPSPSPSEFQSLFCTSVSFSVLHIGLSLPSF